MKATLPVAAALLGSLVLLPACGTVRHRADAGTPATVATLPEIPTVPEVVAAPVEVATIVAAGPIGLSREGRPLMASTLGQGPMRIYLVGGIHGDEPEGQAAIPQVRQALNEPDAGGQALAGLVTVRLLEDMNPDGTYHRSRANIAGVDLNRNWPATNFRPSAMGARAGIARGTGSGPLSEPETASAHADITAFGPHIIVVLHSSVSGPFVNFDGPAAVASLAGQFGTAAAEADPGRVAAAARWRLVPDMGYPTPGSMGSYFGKDLGLPILTVEYKRGSGPLDGSDAGAALVAGLRALAAESTSMPMPLSLTRAAPEPVASEGN